MARDIPELAFVLPLKSSRGGSMTGPTDGSHVSVPLQPFCAPATAASPSMEHFCRTIHPKLFGALLLAHGDRGLAEELSQEALSRVIERWPAIREMSDPEGYTFRIAFNLGRSWFRRVGIERRVRNRLVPLPEGVDHDAASAIAVRAALAQLTARQREAVVYRYFVGRDVADTAAAMGCADGTVRALTAQALTRLREVGLMRDE